MCSSDHDWPFLWCLPAAFAVTAVVGAVLERTLYRHLYGKPHLDQVLFSIGLTFMAVAAVDWAAGSSPVTVQTPEWLRGRFEWGEGAWQLGMGHYRLFVIGVCVALAVGLQAVLTRTRFGSRLRAAVRSDDLVARLGGDEFVVLVDGLQRDEDAAEVGQHLLSAVLRPITVRGTACEVGATIGYALAPLDAGEEAALLKLADAAMYAGKQAGKGRVRRGQVAFGPA